MKWRVRSNFTGKKYKIEKGEVLTMDSKGVVTSTYPETTNLMSDIMPLEGYTVEFAFEQDSEGKWIYCSCVVHS